jgi:CHAT domain-containing protein
MPTTPGLAHGQLRFVRQEARQLARRLPGSVVLIEPDPAPGAPSTAPDAIPVAAPENMPTKANVLAHLTVCPNVHFACHGTSDRADPSQSRLLLHDHQAAPLTVAALSRVLLDHALLAYLSACGTALNTSGRLADEVIHLASAFQLAGYRTVVGTLWAINDDTAAAIADAFYGAITSDSADGPPTINPVGAALALHYATLAARNPRPDVPSLWGAYIHVGA